MTDKEKMDEKQCSWTCPLCSRICGGSENHKGFHQCSIHYGSNGVEIKTLNNIPISAGFYSEFDIDNIEKDVQIALKWKEDLRNDIIKTLKDAIILKNSGSILAVLVGRKIIKFDDNLIDFLMYRYNVKESDIK